MPQISFHVERWVGWRAAGAEQEDAPAAAVPALLRRRVGPIGRRALSTAWAALGGADARFIFSSRHGEFDRTLRLLEALSDQGEVSPAEFSLSVHNALAGLLSIASGNRRGHTTIAGGRDSFGYALLEAGTCLAEEPSVPVLIVHYDDPLPPIYREVVVDDDDEGVALAMVVTGRGEGARLTTEWGLADDGEPPRNLPVEFLEFLKSSEISRASRGGRMIWCWRRG